MGPLHPCRSCRRHIRPTERACPFCGVRVESSGHPGGSLGRAAVLALALGSTGGACGPSQPAPVDPEPVTSDAQPAVVVPPGADAGVVMTPDPVLDAAPIVDEKIEDPIEGPNDDEIEERLKMPYGSPPVRARLV